LRGKGKIRETTGENHPRIVRQSGTLRLVSFFSVRLASSRKFEAANFSMLLRSLNSWSPFGWREKVNAKTGVCTSDSFLSHVNFNELRGFCNFP